MSEEISNYYGEEKVSSLLKEFPRESLSQYPSYDGFKLTSVKAQYIVERMNEVWGYGQWQYEILSTEIIQDEAVSKVKLIPPVGKPFTQYGGGRIKNKNGYHIADGYKASVTDALTKCASYYGIANEVFKGNCSYLHNDKPTNMPNINRRSLDHPATENQILKIKGDIKRSGKDLNTISKFLLKEYKKKTVEALTKTEASQFIDSFSGIKWESLDNGDTGTTNTPFNATKNDDPFYAFDKNSVENFFPYEPNEAA